MAFVIKLSPLAFWPLVSFREDLVDTMQGVLIFDISETFG